MSDVCRIYFLLELIGLRAIFPVVGVANLTLTLFISKIFEYIQAANIYFVMDIGVIDELYPLPVPLENLFLA